MCALFYKNRLCIKKSVISFVYLFCPNTDTKFRELSNHAIPHRKFRFEQLGPVFKQVINAQESGDLHFSNLIC